MSEEKRRHGDRGPAKRTIFVRSRVGTDIAPQDAERIKVFFTSNFDRDPTFWRKVKELSTILLEQAELKGQPGTIEVVDSVSGFSYWARRADLQHTPGREVTDDITVRTARPAPAASTDCAQVYTE